MRQVTQKAALKTYKELAKDIKYRWVHRGGRLWVGRCSSDSRLCQCLVHSWFAKTCK